MTNSSPTGAPDPDAAMTASSIGPRGGVSGDRSLADGLLFTDQYQMTMAQLYFRQGLHERPAQFEHFFRRYPDYGSHQAGYCIAAGLAWLLDWMEHASVTDADIEALRSQRDAAGQQVFGDDFLRWLRANGSFDSLSIRAVPEGRVVHADVPMTIVRGPLALCQILETSLLNHINFQTLIASKAARVAEAARRRPVLEFGMRRAPERGANAASRAALIGGAVASSNVGTSHVLGQQPRGTHAHSMVQAFMALGRGELAAFQAYAEVYPDDCLLLVDTVDTLRAGIPHAITVFDQLRSDGHEPVGIRLDSGDLAYLAVQSAKMLDDAGFPRASIVLSSGLDELLILQILSQIDAEAPRYGVDPVTLIDRLVFGVGSKLSSSAGQPYLDGVYKLVAIDDDAGLSAPAIKISETVAKTQNPGDKDVYRVYDDRGRATADLLTVVGEDVAAMDPLVLQHPIEVGARRALPADSVSEFEPLLVDAMVEGTRVLPHDSLDVMRARRLEDLDRLDPGVRRLVNPHRYHVSLTEQLWDLKQRLITEARRE